VVRLFSSLTNRIFLACMLLATLSLGLAFAFVNARVASEVEAELSRDLTEAGTLVDQRRADFAETFTTMARLIADLPKLKAAVETGDRPTVQPLADDYQRQIDADVLLLTGPSGAILASSGYDATSLPGLVDRFDTATGLDEVATVLPYPHGLLQVVSVPIFIGAEPTGILGRLTVGFYLDDRRAAQLKAVTGSEIAFAANGRVLSASLPPAARASLAAGLGTNAMRTVVLNGEQFVMVARPLLGAGQAGEDGLTTLILRSRSERLRFLDTVRTGLAGALVAALVLATVLSYLVARTVTRPLAAVTDAMRDVAATGDLTRRVTVTQRAWDDEDARLLGGAFNTLTESIASFQRREAQRERLSSLGRLSTVIAHEIRNPLMIIRASLGTLRGASGEDVQEAVADIDEETHRLNRLVTEVLDFARPLRFELAEADLNDVCRASATAAWAGDSTGRVALELDPALPPAMTDAERLRTALVNILGNARQAVESTARPGGAPDGPHVTLKTERAGEHAVITISDDGAGIASTDLARVFEPYFTTRRSGTGLGLPIAKNIIEGLGGSIVVDSEQQQGTRVRIDLPLRPIGVAA
jgi:signal transduction histidine kinase